MAIVPANNEVALLEEVNGLLDDQNIKDESLTTASFEKASLKTYIEEVIKPNTWTAPTFENNYENYETGFEKAAYRKSPDGRVTLRGLIKHPVAIGTVNAFSVPVGYRPSLQKVYICWGENAGLGAGAIRVDITAAGAVVVFGNGAQGIAYVSLAGINFFAD